MRVLVLALVLLFTNCELALSQSFRLRATNYYSLATDLKTEITKWDGKNLHLRILGADDTERVSYPIGSEMIGFVVKKKEARRFFRDAYILVHIHNVKFPNGSLQAEDLKLKIHPRPFFLNKERVGNTIVEATALTFASIFDATIVGLPVSRGGYGIWYSIQEIQDRKEKESILKASLEGFVKGIFFPIPQALSKAKSLDDMAVGSRLTLDKEKKGRSIDAFLQA